MKKTEIYNHETNVFTAHDDLGFNNEDGTLTKGVNDGCIVKLHTGDLVLMGGT